MCVLTKLSKKGLCQLHFGPKINKYKNLTKSMRSDFTQQVFYHDAQSYTQEECYVVP